MGGGGDFPRNVMCSPLSGVEKDEYFDVLPWAKAAGDYLMNFIKHFMMKSAVGTIISLYQPRATLLNSISVQKVLSGLIILLWKV